MSAKEVFFHVGLSKTASTYLQYRVFPKLRGVYYVQRTRYRRFERILARTDHPKYLISNEFDQQLEREMKRIAAACPGARILIVFRRHDAWIASQYRRFCKNGWPFTFREFFDIRDDTGHWKRRELDYMNKVRIIEEHSGRRPLVLFHEELVRDPFRFMDKVAGFLGATYDETAISLRPVHKSFSDRQLSARLWVSKRLNRRPILSSRSRSLRWMQVRGRLLFSYFILYPARLIPHSWFGGGRLIPQEDLDEIRSHWSDDWECLRAYAASAAGAAHGAKSR